LHILSQAPSGLTLNDIRNKVAQDNMECLNWEAFLEEMIVPVDNHTDLAKAEG